MKGSAVTRAMSPNPKIPTFLPDSARSPEKPVSVAHAGIIRRQRAIGPNAAFGNSATFIGILITIFLLLPNRALATVLTREEQSLAWHLVGDSAQHRARGEMELDPILTAVARARAEDLATRRYFSHVNPDGHGPNHLIRAAGYELPPSWGMNRTDNCVESIGAGYGTAEDAWAGWMKSSSHRGHLLALQSFYRNQTSYGVGFYSEPGSPHRTYWVILTAPPSQRILADSALRRANTGGGGRLGFRAANGVALRTEQDDRMPGGLEVVASDRLDTKARFRVGTIIGALPAAEKDRPANMRETATNSRGREDDSRTNAKKTIAGPRRVVFRMPRFLAAIFAP